MGQTASHTDESGENGLAYSPRTSLALQKVVDGIIIDFLIIFSKVPETICVLKDFPQSPTKPQPYMMMADQVSLWEIQEKTRFALGELEPMFLMYKLACESEHKDELDLKAISEDKEANNLSDAEKLFENEIGLQKSTFIKK